MLRGFDFYGKTSLDAKLIKPFSLDVATGVFKNLELNTSRDIIAPKNTTHVQFKSILIGLDAESYEVSVKRSEAVLLPFRDVLVDVVLDPLELPSVTAQVFYLVQVLFYKETNGFQDLAATDSAVLTIQEIG